MNTNEELKEVEEAREERDVKSDVNTKLIRKKVPFNVYSLDATIKRLEELAKEGFFLKKIIGRRFYFVEGTPAKVRYNVEFFGRAALGDSIKDKKTIEFVQSCEEKGWDYVCRNSVMFFFITQKEDAISLVTDSKKKLKNIFKCSGMVEILIYMIWLLMFVIVPAFTSLSGKQYENAVDFYIIDLPSNIYIDLMIIVGLIYVIIKNIVFYNKNKKKLPTEDISYFNLQKERIIQGIVIAIQAILFIMFAWIGFNKSISSVIILIVIVGVFIMGTMGMVHLLSKIFKSNMSKVKKIISSILIYGISIAIYVVGIELTVSTIIYFEKPMGKNELHVEYFDEELDEYAEYIIEQSDIILKRTDLGYNLKENKEEYVESVLDESKSMFGEYYSAYECGYTKEFNETEGYISYTLVKSKYDFILDSFVTSRTLKSEFDFDVTYKKSKKDAKKWKAKECYKISEDFSEDDEYSYYDLLLVYDDMVLYIDYADDELIQNNIDVIYNKLVKQVK